MSPQFVDFDGDNNTDIVVGTFDGSPHVALGLPGGKGWKKPAHILDANGQRIMMNQFWDYEARKWERTNRCDPEGKTLGGHLTSALAWDYDADGDLDLLLGDYDEGHILLRVNDGSAGKPIFRPKNELLEAGGKPIALGKISTLRLVDWDGDGDRDLVASTPGNTYGDGDCGGVYLFANEGTAKNPKFGAKLDLIAPGPKSKAAEPTKPETGLYVDIADADGDEDLDMVVGSFAYAGDGKKVANVWYYENAGQP